MDYQKDRIKFYKLACLKANEIKRIRVLPSSKIYSKQEFDALDYFQRRGFYKIYSDSNRASNIFDTRQSFLLKMHSTDAREKFLDSFNRRNN